ncbi:MAG: TetR/AcrR family transcriptional regulator C-terminal domain-containing protein [Mesorhizobium sp.]
MADVAYIADHPNMPPILLSALTNTRSPALRLMISAFIRRYEQRLSHMIEEGQQRGELRPEIDKDGAARLFVAAIQSLVFTALVRDELDGVREAAPAVFASYRAYVEAVR